MTDGSVDHPDHYGGANNRYETIKVLERLGLGWQFCVGTAIKYISRAGKKENESTLRDLKKARWYLMRIIEMGHESDFLPAIGSPRGIEIPDNPNDVAFAWDLDMLLHNAVVALFEDCDVNRALRFVNNRIAQIT